MALQIGNSLSIVRGDTAVGGGGGAGPEVVLLAGFETDFNDESSAARIATLTGTPTPVRDSGVAKFGTWSAKSGFGTTYVDWGNSPDFQFDKTEDWTLEGWFRPITIGNTGFPCMFGIRFDNNNFIIVYYQNNINGNFYSAQTRNGGTAAFKISATKPVVDQWDHLALVNIGATSTCTLYVKGTDVGNFTSNISWGANEPEGFIFDNGSINISPNGYVDEIRFSTIAQYTSSFTEPTSPWPRP